MAIHSVEEDFQAREGEGTISLSPSKFVKRYVRRFVVVTTDRRDGPLTVLLAPGLPQQFQYYISGNDFDFGARCIKGTAKPRKGEDKIWDATFEYSSDVPPPDNPPEQGGDPANNPEDRHTKYGTGYTTVSRVLDYDPITGFAAINSAGEKFDPPLEREKYLLVATVQKSLSKQLLTLGSDNFSGYINKNQVTINGKPFAKRTLLAHIRQTETFENAVNGAGQPVAYYDTNYEFVVNPDGWPIAPLDQGSRKRIAGKNSGQVYGSDAKIVVITDQFGQPVNRPVNLDGKGKPLTPDKSPVFLDGSNDGHTHTTDFGPFSPFPECAFGTDRF